MIADTTEEQNKPQRLMGEILDDLAQVRQAKASVKQSLDQITANEEALRDELFHGMSAAGIKTGSAAGLMASVKTRRSALVIDQLALVEALDKLGELQDFLKLDSAKAAKYGASKGLPGAAFDEISYLSISEVKS